MTINSLDNAPRRAQCTTTEIKIAAKHLFRPFYVPFIRPKGDLLETLNADFRAMGQVYVKLLGRLTDNGVEIVDGFNQVDALMQLDLGHVEVSVMTRGMDIEEAICHALTVYAKNNSASPLDIGDAIAGIKENLGKRASDTNISLWCHEVYKRSSIGHFYKMTCLFDGFRKAFRDGKIHFSTAKALAYKPITEQYRIFEQYSPRDFAGIERLFKRRSEKGNHSTIQSGSEQDSTDISNDKAIAYLSDALCSPVYASQELNGNINLKIPITQTDVASGILDALTNAGLLKASGSITLELGHSNFEDLISKIAAKSSEQF